ncbi:glycosyl hydrolase, partial [Micromonospora sp. NPDC049559]
MKLRTSARNRFRARALTALATAAVAGAAVTAAVVTASGPAYAATGTITGYGGKCVDVAGASSANGTAVQ